jgi:hypothetical protein
VALRRPTEKQQLSVSDRENMRENEKLQRRKKLSGKNNLSENIQTR